jgi:hypothetical protein
MNFGKPGTRDCPNPGLAAVKGIVNAVELSRGHGEGETRHVHQAKVFLIQRYTCEWLPIE